MGNIVVYRNIILKWNMRVEAGFTVSEQSSGFCKYGNNNAQEYTKVGKIFYHLSNSARAETSHILEGRSGGLEKS